MTLAEVFCVVVFILLLACAVLILAQQGIAQGELDEMKVERDSMAVRLRDAERLNPGKTLLDSLRREAVQLQSRSDSLERVLVGARQERDDAVDRAEYREGQRGGGIDPPPCWYDNGNIEFVFRVEFTERGFILYNIVPPSRVGDEVMRYVRQAEDEREYTPSEFRALARPIYETGRQRDGFGPRGCRYYVRLNHYDGELPGVLAEQPEVFPERRKDITDHFFIRWLSRN